MFEKTVDFIQKIYKTRELIPLHAPVFIGNEKKYLNECINSGYVSSVGVYVNKLEEKIAEYCDVKYAVATSSGTSALHISLLLAGVENDSEVITQPLTFVATCNSIKYCGAHPIFVDVDRDTMGLSPESLRSFLENNSRLKNGQCINNKTGKLIKACLPMHTYGHPCRIDEIKQICDEYHIALVEDAAESLGSKFKGRHTGVFGKLGAMSFNGNKIITSGGGGCIITDDSNLAGLAKHLTTTAKLNHKWDFNHDLVGYNYRMPNINAALVLGQLENLDKFISNKRELASMYEKFFIDSHYTFVKEICDSKSNYWLNTIILKDKKNRDEFLEYTNKNNVMTRPTWRLMNELTMFKDCQSSILTNAKFLEERAVNLPSSVRL